MKTILVVDDEQDILHTLEMILTLEGYKVVLAYDGKQGLERIEDSLPDLIISDIMMPVMDGVEMTQKLRTKPATQRIPIIMLSAIQPDFRPEMKKSWDLFIKKPPDLDRLLQAISRLISQSPSSS